MTRSSRVGGALGEVAGPRVTLRPLRDADLPAIERWFARALRLPRGETGARLREAAGDASRRALALSEGGGDAVGVLTLRAPWPAGGWLAFEMAVLAEEARGRGLALEAVTLVEKEARRLKLASAFAAPVCEGFGRALYFWLRLGYRPLLRSQLPWPDPGGADVWMVRERP